MGITMRRAIAALLLILILGASLSLAGCSDPAEPEAPYQPEESGAPEGEDGDKLLINTLEAPTGPQALNLENLTPLAVEKYARNSDTIGWVRVHNTDIDDVVVHYPHDNNQYYLRRDFEKNSNQYGTYFLDFRATLGDNMSSGEMSTNLCIYGHSMDENANGQAFSQLKKFLNEDFARENPYLHFSTLNEDMAFEIFAVFYATTSLYYNTPEFKDFEGTMEDILSRSVYNYDVEVTENDKFLTLSTCTYVYDPSYPNSYRFAVMGRLVTPGEELKDRAELEPNTTRANP